MKKEPLYVYPYSFSDFFWGLSVMDKIIPDVHHLWVGKDFLPYSQSFLVHLD